MSVNFAGVVRACAAPPRLTARAPTAIAPPSVTSRRVRAMLIGDDVGDGDDDVGDDDDAHETRRGGTRDAHAAVTAVTTMFVDDDDDDDDDDDAHCDVVTIVHSSCGGGVDQKALKIRVLSFYTLYPGFLKALKF